MHNIFLESHNVKNLNFGFGQFNYHLIKGLYNANIDDFKMILHAKDFTHLKNEFGDYFDYKKYYSLRRYEPFRIRKKYDLWHSLNQNTKIEPYFDLPYLLTVHNISYIKNIKDYKSEKNHVLFQEKLNRSTYITYISNYAMKSTHEFFDVPNVPEKVIYNGNTITSINIPKNYKPKLNFKKPYLFSIGEFSKRKNFHTLVEMLHYLPDVNLIISGKNNTAYAEKVKKQIIKNKLENRIFLTGKISEIDKQYYYKNCDAFVFPSLREGFGLPVIEAMKFGKPTFISNNTSLPEIGGKFAFYWNDYDPKTMAEILESGLNTYYNEENFYKKKYIERADSFNWNVTAKKYINVYNKILNL